MILEKENANNEVIADLDRRNRNWEALQAYTDDATIKNYADNGDFTEGTQGWDMPNAVQATVGPDGLSYTKSDGTFTSITTNTVVNPGDILYKSGLIKASSDLVGMANLNGFQVQHSGSGEYERLSFMQTHTVSPARTSIYDERTDGLTDPVYVKNITVINLTDAFGAGNEPNKDEMDDLLRIVPGGFWKGSLPLKYQLTWLLNLIRKINNAVAALGGTP